MGREREWILRRCWETDRETVCQACLKIEKELRGTGRGCRWVVNQPRTLHSEQVECVTAGDDMPPSDGDVIWGEAASYLGLRSGLQTINSFLRFTKLRATLCIFSGHASSKGVYSWCAVSYMATHHKRQRAKTKSMWTDTVIKLFGAAISLCLCYSPGLGCSL